MTQPELPTQDPRIYFAAERTLLAWIRTGLAMMGFGFVVARFGLFLREMQAGNPNLSHQSPRLSVWFGIALVIMGVIVNLAAAVSHRSLIHRLQSGTYSGGPSRSGMVVAITLAVVGGAVATYLLLFR